MASVVVVLPLVPVTAMIGIRPSSPFGNSESTIALVHILDRGDYGTYSIAVTVSMFLLALNDLAVGYAITRYQGDDVEELAGTAGTLALGLSTVLYGIVFVSAPAIVSLFNPPAGSSAVGIVRLAALAIVIDGTIAAPTGLIERRASPPPG